VTPARDASATGNNAAAVRAQRADARRRHLHARARCPARRRHDFRWTQTIDGTGTLVFQGQPSVRVNGGTLSIGARISEADSR